MNFRDPTAFDFQMLAYASKVRARVAMMRDNVKLFVPDVDFDVGMPCNCLACYMRVNVHPLPSVLFGTRYHHSR